MKKNKKNQTDKEKAFLKAVNNSPIQVTTM